VSFPKLHSKHFVLLILMIASSGRAVAKSNALLIPDHQTYRAFLLEEWKPSKPSVVMMLDPFGPYCTPTLQQKEQLNAYNIFLFWSPILGPASEKRVAQILRCRGPASPVVISSVIEREAPKCKDSEEKEQIRLNKSMIDVYHPNSVPAYYFGGRRVSLNQLDGYTEGIQTLSGTTRVDWARYGSFRVAQPTNGLAKVGVLLPRQFEGWSALISELRSATQFDWHLFPYEENVAEHRFCSAVPSCDQLNARQAKRKREELMLLLGVPEVTRPRFILNDKLLTPDEAQRVFGFGDFSSLGKR
jgi:hypothetical protein